MLINDENKVVTGVKNILEEEVIYYKQLYSSCYKPGKDQHNIRENIYKKFMPNLDSDYGINDIDENFTECKIRSIIDSFAYNKSPGSDGLPIEFYVTFWQTIKQYLINSYKSIWQNNQLGISQNSNKGHIRLFKDTP